MHISCANAKTIPGHVTLWLVTTRYEVWEGGLIGHKYTYRLHILFIFRVFFNTWYEHF